MANIIDTTNIDITKPASGAATTQSVRDNFSAIKTELDKLSSSTTAIELPYCDIGDPGLETSGINVNGTTYDSGLRINDIGTNKIAQVVVHRHSTTLQPLILGARANSETSSHSAVTAGQSLFSLFGAGYTGTHYDLFAEIVMQASSSGSISSSSSPGKIVLSTTPDGSNTPATVLTLDQDKSSTFAGTLVATNGGSLTGTWSDLGTVTTVDINGGTIDGVTIGATSAPTVTNLGSVATCDINGGTIDGCTIGSTNTFPAGMIIQHVYTETGAVSTGSTTIPSDDSIPQNTEGDQYMSLAITPKYTNSILRIDVVVNMSNSVANNLIAALFQDTTANALAATQNYQGIATGLSQVLISHYMVSGTVSSTTFYVRAGGSAAGTTTFNGRTGARIFGGVIASSISIMEIKV